MMRKRFLLLCEGNGPVIFLKKGPAKRSCDFLFLLSMNKIFSKQVNGLCFDTSKASDPKTKYDLILWSVTQ